MSAKCIRKTVIYILVVAMALSQALTAFAEPLSEMYDSNKDPVVFQFDDSEDYLEKKEYYKDLQYSAAMIDERITVTAEDFIIEASANAVYSESQGKNTLLWDESIQKLSFELEVPVSGLYTFGFTYSADTAASADIVRGMKVDGATPFSECTSLILPRVWENTEEVKVNSLGDEVCPIMTQSARLQSEALFDGEGRYSEPLQLYLEAGAHAFEFTHVSMSVYVAEFFLDTYTSPEDYSTVSAEYTAKNKASKSQIYEFEDSISFTNSSVLNMNTDGDPLCSPISRGNVVMNVVGGEGSYGEGNSVTYSFKVEQSGLYKLAMRVEQNHRDGLPAYRRIAIDGTVPFTEFLEYRFGHVDNWRTEVLSDGKGEPYYVYLEAGEHTVTLTGVQGEFYPLIKTLEQDAQKLSDLLLKIRKIIGNDPDYNYDYQLDTQIPHLIPTLDEIKANMEMMMTVIEDISKQTTAKYNELKNMIKQIDRIKEDIFKLPRRMDDLDTIVSQYSVWISQFAISPLTMDWFGIYADDAEIPNKSSNFFQVMYSTLVNFVLSFTKDYNNVASFGETGEVKQTIDVWVSRGTDWGNLTKRLIDSDFTPNTGIGVKMNIVTAGQLNAGAVNTLMLSIASGRAPDVCLGVDTASIGEFAMRDVLVDLTSFEKFEEYKDYTYQELLIPNTYNGGVYGLPETMNFLVMLYRKDILSDLGLALPDTWEELYNNTLPILLSNNMEFYLPLSAGWSLYPTLLYQHGGELYNDTLTACNLNTATSYNAFSELCDLVRVYGFETTANFFNRFRSGEMPIGFADMTVYMQILTAAPELADRWGITVIPGHEKQDGTIDRTHLSATGTSVMIVDNGNGKEKEAFEFVSWWMSEATQLDFGYMIEAEMGTSARWNSANKQAFFGMAWDKEDMDIIKQSFEQINAIPIVMGGYYTTRYVNNAFNSTAISNGDKREALEEAQEKVDAELERRRK